MQTSDGKAESKAAKVSGARWLKYVTPTMESAHHVRTSSSTAKVHVESVSRAARAWPIELTVPSGAVSCPLSCAWAPLTTKFCALSS